MAETGKILRLSRGKIATILALASAVFSFSGFEWLVDLGTPEFQPVRPSAPKNLTPPDLPAAPLAQTDLKTLVPLPPPPPPRK